MAVLESRDTYLTHFNALERRGPAQPAWLRDLRRGAMARFDRVGFPTTRDEEWRFTPVSPLAARAFRPAFEAGSGAPAPGDLASFAGRDTPAARLVFVGGRYSPELSRVADLQAGVRAGRLADALAADPDLLEHHLGRLAANGHAFTALNTAFIEDGAFVQVPARTILSAPIHVLFAGGADTVAHPRILVLAGPESQACLIEGYAGREGEVYFTNAVTELVVGENAVVDHYKVIRDSRQAFHVGSLYVRAARNANVSSHSITLGGALVRNDVVAVLDGEGIDCTLNGLYLADGQRLVDNHTTIDHAKPHCGSHEVYKGILDGHGRAVFNGKIIVRPDAQKTDAKQTNKALLLSEGGQINTKPQLEIFADDVKCTHGATVGQLDEEALFYLRTRGIGREDARNMLIHAFAADILNRVKVEELRAVLEAELFAQLERDGHSHAP